MPIPFTCPHCGAQTNVPDELAGQSGPCATCGEKIVIPSSGVPAKPGGSSSGGWGGAAVVLAVLGAVMVVFVLCGGVLVALLLPAVQSAREAARRMQCSNNLKQIALALHNYHDTYREFPPAYFTDEDGEPTHSWRVMILPFLGRDDLYAMYDFNEPWDGPNNSRLASMMPEVYNCPSSPNQGQNTHYMVVTGAGTMWPGAESVSISDITDGTSNTIMVVEVAGASKNWMAPNDLDITAMPMQINATKDGQSISSYHPGGANMAMADGSVRFFSETIDPQTLQSALTRDGGEAVMLP